MHVPDEGGVGGDSQAAETDALARVEAARDRTVAAGLARVEHRLEHHLRLPQRRTPARGQPAGVKRRFLGAIGRRLWRRVNRHGRFSTMSTRGVFDPAGERYQVHAGEYAVLRVGDRQWAGLARTPVAQCEPEAPHGLDPLWLFGLVAGVIEAWDAGAELVNGTRCHRYSLLVDLSQASARAPHGRAAPARPRFEALLALPVDVWLDDKHVRRVRYAEEHHSETLELWDLGLAPDEVDWTRLPESPTS